MAITRYAGDRFTIAAGETKPTGVLDGAVLIDTGNLTQHVKRTVAGTSQWSQIAGGGGGGSPGGTDTQVQFNNAGAFGGDADLTFTDGNRLNVNKLGISGNIYDSNNSIGNNGMVLTNEGTTGVNWKAIEDVLSGVGGSGVANYVARWADEDTLTTGVLVDNGTNVGINVPSPNFPLEISSSSNATIRIEDTTNTSRLDLRAEDSAVLIRSTSNFPMRFDVNQTERMRIDTAGKVGIGTDNPSYRLDIGGSTSSTVNTLRLHQANGGTAIRVGPGGGGNDITLLRVDGTSSNNSGATDSGNVGFSLKYMGSRDGNLNALSIFTDNITAASQIEAVTVVQDGNVGIGAPSPSAKLHIKEAVSGLSSFDGTADTLILESNANGGMTIVTAAANTGRIIFASPNDATGAEIKFSDATDLMTIGTTTPNADLALQAGNGAEAVRILDDGNVGIGTTNPSAKIDVVGASVAGGAIHSLFRNSADTNSYLRIENNYSVAAGFSPKIAGYYNGATQSGLTLYSSTGNTTSTTAEPVMGFEVGTIAAGASQPAFQWLEGSSPRMTIDKGGNVGIGTATPRALFDVRTTVDGDSFPSRITSTDGSFTDEQKLGIEFAQNAVVLNQFYSKYDISLGGWGFGFKGYSSGLTDELFTIGANGNVGIGTGNPTSLLHLQSASSPTLQVIDTTNNVTAKIYSQNLNAHVGTTSNHDFSIDSNNTSRIYVEAAGNVGIGTVAPSQKLHVQGNLRVTGAYYASDNNAGSSNQVLTSTGSGGTDWKSLSQISDTVTGDGTTNKITKWENGPDSDLTDSSFLSESGTTLTNTATVTEFTTTNTQLRLPNYGRVAIGAASTNSVLLADVGDNATFNNGEAVIKGENSGNRGTVGHASGSDLLRLNFSDALGMILNKDGHVGIGTDPKAKFEVDLNQTNGTLAADNYAHFGGQHMSNGYVMGITLGYREANLLYRKVGIVARGLGDAHARQDLDFLVSTATGSASVTPSDAKLTISGSTGYVGIGTTTPAQQLHLTGSIRMPNTTSTTTGIIYKDTSRFIHNYQHPTGDTAVPAGLNTFVGISAGNLSMGSTATAAAEGSYNSGFGYQVLNSLTTGYSNTAVGFKAGNDITTAIDSTLVGMNAGGNIVNGSRNTFIGDDAGFLTTSGANNVAVGARTIRLNTTGSNNTIVGTYALDAHTSPAGHTTLGYSALTNLTTGSYNIAIGYAAGSQKVATGNLTNASYGIYLGYAVDGTEAASGEIVIGKDAKGLGSNTTRLGGSNITKTVIEYGNVGIGKTDPDSPLHVYTTAEATARFQSTDNKAEIYVYDNDTTAILGAEGANIYLGSSTGSAAGFLRIATTTGNATFGAAAEGNTRLKIVPRTVEIASNSTNYQKAVYASGLNFYDINSGVTDSGYRIAVDASVFVSDADFEGTLADQYAIWARHGANVSAAGSTITRSIGVYIDSLTNANTTITNLYGLYQEDSVAKNYFSGSVGIGTTTSGSKLHVNGGSKYFGGGDWTTIERVTTTEGNYALYVQTTGTNTNQAIAKFNYGCTAGGANTGTAVAAIARQKSYFLSKLGIGITDPSANLTVLGVTGTTIIQALGTDSNGHADVEIKSTGTTGASRLFFSDTADQSGFIKYNHVDNSMQFGTSTSVRMHIDTNGNVGIGTAVPSQKLHVQGTLRLTGAFYDSNNAAGTSGQVLTSTGSATDWKDLDEISGVTASNPTTTNYVTKWSDGTNEVITDSLIYDNGTNVGIGTATPLGKLDILRFSSAEPGLIARANKDGAKMNFAYTNSNSMGEIGTTYNNSTGAMRLWIGGNLNSNSTGHVGPTQQGTSSSSWFSEYNTSNDYYQINRIAAGGGTSSSTLFYITSAGNVGIGGVTPTLGKLQVAGRGYFGPVGTGDATTKALMDTYSVLKLKPHNTNSTNMTFAQVNGGAGIGIQVTNGTQTADWDIALNPYGGNVGIGTDNPTTKLEIFGGQYSSNYPSMLNIVDDETAFSTNNNGGGISFGANYASGTIVRFIAGIQGVKENNTSGNYGGALRFSVRENGTSLLSEKMRVASTGKVGIGTTSPDNTLHVRSGATNSVARFESTDATARILLQDNSGQAGVGATGDDIVFTTSSSVSERMRIDSSGDVGIGTAAPSRALEVYRSGAVDFGLTAATSGNASAILKGRSNATNIATGPAQGGGNLTLYNLDTSDGNFNGVGFYNSSSLITSGILGVNVSHSSRHGALVFQTHNGSSLLERMRIDKDGNVGIGTTLPSQKLHVQGTLRLTGAFYDSNNVAGTSGQVLTSTGSATDWKDLDEISGVTASNPTTTNYVTKWSDGTNEVITDSLIYDNGTNVGIGTPSPAARLQVNQVASDQSGAAAIKAIGTAYGTNKTIHAYMGTTSNTKSLFYAENSNGVVMNIAGDGKVGIGTVSPECKLDIHDHTSATTFIADNNAGVRITNWGGNTGWSLLGFGGFSSTYTRNLSQIGSLSTSSGTYLAFGTSNNYGTGITNQAMTIDPSGKVGIGTTSPSDKLHVVQNIDLNTALFQNTSGRAQVIIDSQTTAHNSYLTLSNGGSEFAFLDAKTSINLLRIATNNTGAEIAIETNSQDEAVRIDSAGNVGIGNTNPNNNLVVSDGVQPSYAPTTVGEYIEIARTSGADAGFLINKNTGQWLFGIDNSDGTNPPLRFEYSAAGSAHPGLGSGTLGLALKSDGNVGIGTPSPSAKLQVKNAISTVYANVAPSVSNSIIAISNTQTSETTNDQAQIQFGVNGGTHNRVGSIGLIAESASSRKAALVFATDDAGTRAEKMRITGDGSLGINCTPNANYKLDVNGDAARIGGNQTSTALLIEASDDSGAPSYTSIIKFKGYESRAQGIFFENNSYSGEEWFCGMNYSGSFNSWNIGYDEAGGQAEYLANTKLQLHYTGKLQLHTYGSGAHTGTAAYKLSVDSSGNVIETAIGAGAVDGSGIEDYVAKWTDTDTLGIGIIRDNGNVGIGVAPANGYKLKVDGNGYFSGTLTEASSLAIKENIENFTPSIDKINKIRPVKYNKKGSDKKEIGLIAEELEELFPELVEKDENGNPSGVNYSRAVTVLLGGFKELYKELQEIKKRI